MDAALDKEVHNVDSTALATEPFVSITTFKRDGTPVSVPVWCAADNGTLLVFSEADSWKVKRIRRDPMSAWRPAAPEARHVARPSTPTPAWWRTPQGSKGCWPRSTLEHGPPTARSWW
jgi:Pyridoxamine 5'-phosphate oxidase